MHHMNQGAGVRPARQDPWPDWSTWCLWVLEGYMVCSPPTGDASRTSLLPIGVRRGWSVTRPRPYTLISDYRSSSHIRCSSVCMFIMDAVRGIYKRGSGVCRECMVFV
jgi:hypothetical protein